MRERREIMLQSHRTLNNIIIHAESGVPPGPIICMFTTIQNLNPHIHTIYSDSELSFGGDLWVVQVQGVL